MNGRELVVLIMQNNLEEIDIFSEDFLGALMPTVESVAARFNVGVATVEVWLEDDCLEGVVFDGVTYIFPDSLKKFIEIRENKEANDV